MALFLEKIRTISMLVVLFISFVFAIVVGYYFDFYDPIDNSRISNLFLLLYPSSILVIHAIVYEISKNYNKTYKFVNYFFVGIISTQVLVILVIERDPIVQIAENFGSTLAQIAENFGSTLLPVSGKKYTCAECGNKFSGQPYQCALYYCVKAKTIASALPKFDSCDCGVKYMRKQGFRYQCR